MIVGREISNSGRRIVNLVSDLGNIRVDRYFIPTKPFSPAPRPAWSKTVSAWSSFVWPVTTPYASYCSDTFDRTSYLKVRAAVSIENFCSIEIFGTFTEMARNLTPRESAIFWEASSSASEESTRIWWFTWQAIRLKHFFSLRTDSPARRAEESGPPEKATIKVADVTAKHSLMLKRQGCWIYV